jgi:hypothetical protein
MTIWWAPTARSELADLWLHADSMERRAIGTAAHAIDKRLEVDPADQGESRGDGCRILFERPLGAVFRVEQERSSVVVLRGWQFH